MIHAIEALNFRCLHYVRQQLRSFNVLVGPNASGKTTFLDTVAFLGDLLSNGLEAAVQQRTSNFRDLVWLQGERPLEIAVNFIIPEKRRRLTLYKDYDVCRYEISVGLDGDTGEISISGEKVLLKKLEPATPLQLEFFPMQPPIPDTILTPRSARNIKMVVNKVPGGNDNFYSETDKGWAPSFKLGARKSALANLPDDESRFPVATWLKGMLMEGIQRMVLNSMLMRKPSPPGQPRNFRPDGSNLPWVIDNLAKSAPNLFQDWIMHLRTALPDLEDIKTIERPEDRHRYLVVRYRGGLEVPSWMVSDGTLRLLALTLPAYIPDLSGIFLIEEPENGIHPRAIETVFQSLSSVYSAQVLLATHSPVILSVAEPEQVLCFAKTDQGETSVVRGTEHPALKEWRGETNLGVLFAGGVLG
ncbi:methylation-associated defense system AAA family ATPase MAD3 [Moorella sp. Hama-1]|uniref:methylation-associated defense system AAA family ATPase MAD3 n=1 Tax=Moorella sp. Hama-1 TaxID=2138101 RepID=UPI000D642F28|nr:ATP-binding protein [Moorella sp. Hama-1]BCV20946.1 ATPase [Moorella sp. Hama-1]